ncbi:type II toxin-antitoxin system prevent-host-death family antitoxin [Aquipuribacter nitratireducens]|uniref:Antitoxin n=1 Tax=Aquipuribacter nitratireducens TaxID=650104 RepID=A0ABW0GU76_9MICO
MSVVVNISEAKAQLSRLIERARRGETVVIGNAGRPVAVLVAYEHDPSPRVLGGWKGRVRVAPEFDDPLPEELATAFGDER